MLSWTHIWMTEEILRLDIFVGFCQYNPERRRAFDNTQLAQDGVYGRSQKVKGSSLGHTSRDQTRTYIWLSCSDASTCSNATRNEAMLLRLPEECKLCSCLISRAIPQNVLGMRGVKTGPELRSLPYTDSADKRWSTQEEIQFVKKWKYMMKIIFFDVGCIGPSMPKSNYKLTRQTDAIRFLADGKYVTAGIPWCVENIWRTPLENTI